jgi:SAM-dependent methyltransferase
VAERKGGDFSGLSQCYQRYRPDYPPEVTAAAVAFLEAGGQACDAELLAIDVGSGTGISTRAWRRALGGLCRLIGIDPGEDMCREAVASTAAEDQIKYLIGTAEALPIATGAAGLITAAQAAHWFNRPRFYVEAHRLLRPAGVIAIMFNNRDWTASSFLARYETFLETHSAGYRSDHRSTDFTAEFARLSWAEPGSSYQYRWERRLPLEDVKGLLLSSSVAQRVVGKIGENCFLATISEMVVEAVDADGLVRFPYLAEIHMARKRRI